MQPNSLFEDGSKQQPKSIPLGAGLSLEYLGGVGKSARKALLYRQGIMVKEVNLADPVAKRLFIVETIEMGAGKSRLAKTLCISRQTIHNYLEIKKRFGMEGLVQGYDVGGSKSRRKQRQSHKAPCGNKAKMVAEIREKERKERENRQLPLNFDFPGIEGNGKSVEPAEQPFAEEHNWEATRYAGTFLYLPTLISQWNWLRLVMVYFGEAYRIFMVFLLMAGANFRSIEQLKNVRAREAGLVLGIRRLACRPKLWEWFYDAARERLSQVLLTDFFRYQIRAGLVGIWLWFTDGHLLPYSGKYKVHSAYNTQRRMPVPGRTSMVTCDADGRVVDFEIQEGKGNLRAHIVALGKKWAGETPQKPVMVFDREGYGDEFFAGLVTGEIPFVTWEKNVDTEQLAAIEDSRFATKFELNGKHYGVFEGEKVITLPPKENATEKTAVTLRRIYLWNKTSKRRTSGLAWTTPDAAMTTEDCARAILCRWGASENTFKHIKARHPFHYHPGFKLTESERQDIANPEIKKKDHLIGAIKKGLSTLYKKLSKAKEVLNSDGTPRQNSVRERLQQTIAGQEAQLASLNDEKKQLPERVDVSSLTDYASIKQVDDEGKYLFDFVTSSVWNARKQMVEWLGSQFDEENEVVDLFYAITDCHGWIRSTNCEVRVRLEPLQQPKRRQAQEQLCRRLTSLVARTPNGKSLVIEVGEAPEQKRPKK